MGVELKSTTKVQASALPADTFRDWDHTPEPDEMVDVEVVFDYVPRHTERGGTWDEVLAAGGYFESVWLIEGGFAPNQECILDLLSKEQREHEYDQCEVLLDMMKDDYDGC